MTNRVTKTNGQVRSMYRRLGREDLTCFDREAKDLILGAMEVGCVGRVSAKGHVILRNNAGGTASVPRSMTTPNRSAQNARADIKRLLREHQEEAGADAEPDPETTRPRSAAAQRVSVSRAFRDHGMAFSQWFDSLGHGLPADALVEVAFDAAGQTSFSLVRDRAVPMPIPATDPDPDPAEQEGAAVAEPAKTPTPTAEAAERDETGAAPEEVLQRVRAALGEDPRVAQLEARVAELEEALREETSRAERAAARLALIQEAMSA